MSYQGYGQPYGQPPPPPPQGYSQHAPPQGQYPPQPGQYPPPQGQYPQYGQYAPPQGQYPPPQGHYPPPQGGPYSQYPPAQAPQGGYYQSPTPQGQYPPQQAPYGQPPPQPYGASPQHQQPYGAPTPGQYGAPPPQPGAQYGAPAPAPYGQIPPTPPSPGYGPPQIIQYDATADADALRRAMKGFGTDEKALVNVLARKDPLQIEVLRTTYERRHKRSLIDDIEKETRSWFEYGLVQLARGPLMSDVHNLYKAMSGPGTKEIVMNDILLSRSNADLKAIKSAYQQTFRRSLENDVKGELSLKTERHFLIVLNANRAEDMAPVNPQQVEEDVMSIYRSTEGKFGTDEILVCSILSTRNDNQIRAIAHLYKQKFNRDLDNVISSEFSGHMKDALLFQLRHAVDRYMHAAQLLEDSMAGLGTKDHLLVSRVIRFHWDRNELANIKGAYQQRYRKSLASRIRSETSGDYQMLMVACVGE
ncbi:Calpactin I heavy chain, calcium ion binding [Trichoderma parareesei]|uniref:Annexin n=1 Tax=Trichoderma parareesei TaxID=858221 RepID=A0A2H2ZCP1_TRIPA|nr:Calpactin I heavy chain, calcium ion binding [Trichoderma parareesei]